MDPRTTTSGRPTSTGPTSTGPTSTGRAADRRRAAGARRRPPITARRPGLYLAVAAAGAVALNVLVGADPAATAGTRTAGATTSESVDVARQLGLTTPSGTVDAPDTEDLAPLEDLSASRSSREAAQTEAQQSRAEADRAELDRREAEAEEAEKEAEEEAAAEEKAKEEAAAAERSAAATAGAPAGSAAPAAPAPAAAPAPSGAVARISNSAGGVRPSAQAAANSVVSNVPGAAGITIGGTRPSAADPGGHPSGLALDYMVGVALGNAIAQYHVDNWDALGVEYVIWQQRMLSSPGGSWQTMENRGSATANHMDHVHVNYRG